MNIILASSSPTRHTLLSRLKIPFQTHRPDINETARPDEMPNQLAFRLATEKAQAIKLLYPNHLIIGCDQVATLDGRTPIRKPQTQSEAFQQLQKASGQCMQFFTGVSVLNSHSGAQNTSIETFKVYFRILNDEEIHYYINNEDVLGCAGSFKAEGLGSALFRKLEGDDPTSLMGLPLIGLCRLLQDQQISILNGSVRNLT